MTARIVSFLVAVLGAFAFASPAFADTKVVDDDKVQCPDAEFTSIQTAVDAATSGDGILVCAGRYGPTHIPAGKNLELKGARGYTRENWRRCRDDVSFGDDPLVHSIVSGGLRQPAFEVENSRVEIYDFTIRDAVGAAGVDLKGAGSVAFFNSIVKDNTIGLRVDDGPRAEWNVVEHCFAGNNAPGNGSGTAVLAELDVPESVATIRLSLFTRHASGSVTVTGSGPLSRTHASISSSQFVNDAPIHMLGVDGVQILTNRIKNTNGSAIVLTGTGHSTMNENKVNGCAGSGIEIHGGRPHTLIRNEIFGCSQYGLLVSDMPFRLLVRRNVMGDNGLDGIRLTNVVRAKIKLNRIERNGRDGLRIDADSLDNVVELNTALGSTEHDCHDDSIGSGTGGTANTWIDNVGRTDSPDGICTPP
jgi:hypothetical protein